MPGLETKGSSMHSLDWGRVALATSTSPLRVLFSSCLLGNRTGWEGDAYTEPLAVRLASLPNVRVVHFCPETSTLGVPRPLTTLYDGNGHDVLAGRARVLETTGRDVTNEIMRGAKAMLDLAREHDIDLAVLLDVSDSCGSHVVYRGAPEERRYQRGMGVAAATLASAGFPVIAQRDFASLQKVIGLLDSTFVPDPGAFDFKDHPWFREYFGAGNETK